MEGFVGADADTKTFDSGTTTTRLRLATTERGYITRLGVQVPDRTTWHTVVLWGGLARVAQQIKKGTRIAVRGKYESRRWTDASGIEREVYEINADELHFLERPADSKDGNNNGNSDYHGTERTSVDYATFPPGE